MLEAYSPSGSESEVAKLLCEEMWRSGMDARIDPAGNAVGVLGSEGPRILLCGHMDTVPGRIPVRVEDDSLYGRGAVDAKASLAAMIIGSTLAKQRSTLPLQITVVGVVEEETTSRGIRAVMEEMPSYDLAIFGEPSGVSNIIVGYKGSLKLHLSFHTMTAHSAAPWISTSSYEESTSFWTAFQREFLDNKAESKFEAVTGCVTNIISNGPGNSVPAETTLDIDVRVPPTMKSNDLADAIRKFTSNKVSENNDVKIDLRIDDETDAFLGSTSSYLVSAFRWAIRRVRGGQVALLKKTGTGDINLFAQTQNIPMFAYGPGDSRLDHTEIEHVSISEYLASIEVYARALPRIAERARSTELVSASSE
jgi:LysW-gamma-L-lysine carboxypeptidase